MHLTARLALASTVVLFASSAWAQEALPETARGPAIDPDKGYLVEERRVAEWGAWLPRVAAGLLPRLSLGISCGPRDPALDMVLTRLRAALQLLAASLLVTVMSEPLRALDKEIVMPSERTLALLSETGGA